MPAIPHLVPEFVSFAAKNSVPHSGVHFPLFVFGSVQPYFVHIFAVYVEVGVRKHFPTNSKTEQEAREPFYLGGHLHLVSSFLEW